MRTSTPVAFFDNVLKTPQRLRLADERIPPRSELNPFGDVCLWASFCQVVILRLGEQLTRGDGISSFEVQ